ncbi:DUF1638 domain-containing protein [Alkalibaculum sp. M08DMB]|uniref:DUF1638 domain-containing protein n=1 Tax=Alkalibaculum sporogenes TaxID=2655001 RepID=A0A6A7K5D1_9FIRM|nr:DUF1638 domain-containing protein [Alkalibaculum sporogenes]MPW24600.1 DUF1638 domain-containing protein [Alkalibaculum sporogenes]
MNNLLIACETLRDEIVSTIEKFNFIENIIWMNASLHNNPDLLRSELQNVIDSNSQYDHILLSYGTCGNAIIGIRATHSKLVIPVFADCIGMLLCKHKSINDIRKDTYFLTKGWINGEKSIIVEYNHCLDKYGEKRAKRIFTAMLKHYKNLMLIDTKSYILDEYQKISQDIAQKIDLNLVVESGSLHIIEKLLKGEWDKDFCIIECGEEALLEHFKDAFNEQQYPHYNSTY